MHLRKSTPFWRSQYKYENGGISYRGTILSVHKPNKDFMVRCFIFLSWKLFGIIRGYGHWSTQLQHPRLKAAK